MSKIIPFIFASGLGTRLRPLTEETPKSLLTLKNDKTFLDYILQELIKADFSEAFINYAYRLDLFERKIAEYANSLKITLIDDFEVCGQGEILAANQERLAEYDYVLGMNGDTIIEGALTTFAADLDDDIHLLSNNAFPVPANLLCDEQGTLAGLNPEPNVDNPHWYTEPIHHIHRHNYLGYLLMPTKHLAKIKHRSSFMGLFHEGEVIEQLVRQRVVAHVTSAPINFYGTANTIEELEQLRRQLA